MARVYQRKFCADGSINPQWKPDTRKRKSGKSGKSGKSKPRVTKFDRAEFVAWDSEGADIDGKHTTICLLNSEGRSAIDVQGLSSHELLEFMADGLAANPYAIHVGFVFSYDVNMILRELPRERIAELWERGRTWYRAAPGIRYLIRYRPRKEFGIWRYRRGVGKWVKDKETGDLVFKETGEGGTIWDVFGFFQSSFVKALKDWNVAQDVAERIQQMKLQRSSFSPDNIRQIVDYCREECVSLVKLMSKLHECLRVAGIPITRWDGAGSVAGALLKREGIKNHKLPLPPQVEQAALHAYFGGRIELLAYGNEPQSQFWECDVRSAYPSAIQHLPCLSCGEWIHNGVESDFTMVRVRWNVPDYAPFCPLPWRAETTGNVYFPPRGEGWYWWPEIESAVRHWGITPFTILETYTYKTECTHKPFAFVPQLYQLRADWRAAGNAAEKVLKLGLNSLYGKLAQRTGGRIVELKDGTKEWRDPPYYNIAWAGWITSRTRALLHDAAWDASQRGRVIMFATDAIYCDSRPDIVEGEQLGAWETKQHTGMTTVQSGVYWLGGIGSDKEKKKVRGFDTEKQRESDKPLERGGIIEHWRKRQSPYQAQITRFVGMGRALTGDAQWELWCKWHTEPRKLSLYPTGKRIDMINLDSGRRMVRNPRPHLKLIPTMALDPAFERERQGWLSAPTESPAQDGGASEVGTKIRTEHECLEI